MLPMPIARSRIRRWNRGARLATLFAITAFGGLSLAAAPEATISPSVAALFVGEEKVVEGTVTAAERESNVVRLQLGKPPQDITVSLVLGLLSNFPPTPENYYLGKSVRVAGTIRSFRGVPEIMIRDPADLQVVGAVAAGAPVGVAPAAGAATMGAGVPGAAGNASLSTSEDLSVRQRIDALVDRIRQLEERVRQLEDSRAR